MRSYLIVPGDDGRKLEDALKSGADALILDLQDLAGDGRQAAARLGVLEFLRSQAGKSGPALFVRLNGLSSGQIDADLDAIMPGAPCGVVLPGSTGGRDVTQLGAKLAVREAESDLPDGATRILALATQSARAIFGLSSYEGATRRLIGLAWGVETLAADVGAEAPGLTSTVVSEPFRLARSLCLFAAAAAGVAAIDAVELLPGDEPGLIAAAEQARRDGFSGKLAVHPDQIGPINRSFTRNAMIA